MTASELFAKAIGSFCFGQELCHWCAGPCDRRWVHDDPPPIPYQRTKSTAKRPGCRHVCVGCYYYRMKRVTVRFLKGGFLDKQRPEDFSWWVTEEGALAIRKEDHSLLWEYLLNPPSKFYLSLLTDPDKIKNHIQLCIVNDFPVIDIDTQLQFTINNVIHSYTVYELEEAISNGEGEGKESGVRELLRILSPYSKRDEKQKRGAGRPKETINPLLGKKPSEKT